MSRGSYAFRAIEDVQKWHNFIFEPVNVLTYGLPIDRSRLV